MPFTAASRLPLVYTLAVPVGSQLSRFSPQWGSGHGSVLCPLWSRQALRFIKPTRPSLPDPLEHSLVLALPKAGMSGSGGAQPVGRRDALAVSAQQADDRTHWFLSLVDRAFSDGYATFVL